MVTIAVWSQKGGVGKTLTCANLAASLADLGLAVLMTDFDPQGDLSASWGLDGEAARPRIEDVLEHSGTDIRDIVEHIPLGDGYGSLALLPTVSPRLRRQTSRLLAGGGRHLAAVLAPWHGRFDVALVDTPAGDTVFGRQAIVAADAVIVPMLPGFHELRALTRALDAIDEQAEQEGTRVELLGVLVVNADARWRSTREYRTHLAGEQQLALFDTVIPRHQPVTDHARYGLPTVWLRPSTTVAAAYRDLASEVTNRVVERYGLDLPEGLAVTSAGASQPV
jgi:chromosome partitioning protein